MGEGLPLKAGSCAYTRMENQSIEGFQSESHLQHSSKCESLGPLHFIICSRLSKGRCGLQSPTSFTGENNNPTLDVTIPGSAISKIQSGHLLLSQSQPAPQRSPCSWHLTDEVSPGQCLPCPPRRCCPDSPPARPHPQGWPGLWESRDS